MGIASLEVSLPSAARAAGRARSSDVFGRFGLRLRLPADVGGAQIGQVQHQLHPDLNPADAA